MIYHKNVWSKPGTSCTECGYAESDHCHDCGACEIEYVMHAETQTCKSCSTAPLTTTTAAVTSITWPYESSESTPAQQVRIQEFRDDIETARKNHWAGYSYHIWLDSRLHDSAVTHADAFDECRAQRKAGHQGHLLIGSGFTDRTLTVSALGEMLRIELPV